MIDPFVLLTPVLLLAIFALVRCVGCIYIPPFRAVYVAVAPGDTKVFLSWELNTSEPYTGDFLIKRGTSAGGPYTQVGSVPSTVNAFTDRGLTNATTYHYVVALDDSGENAFSQEVSAVPAPILFRQFADFADTSNTNADTVAAPPFANLSAGSLVVVWIFYSTAAQTVASVSDTAGNQYQRAAGPTAGTGPFAAFRQELWYARGTAAGTGVIVSALFTGLFTQEKAIAAHEYTGAAPGDPFDDPFDVASAAASAAPTVSSGSAIASDAGLIFGAAIFVNLGTAGPGFTPRSSLQNNVSEDARLPAAGPAEATFTNPTPGQEWIAQMAVFR